jgi:uncharacterized repeat protein (TIGR04076 family)
MSDETTGAGPTEPGSEAGGAPDMELYDIRIVVDRIEGRSVCDMRPGDYAEVVNSSQLRIPRHFCLYALNAVLPLIPAKQRRLPSGDWLETEGEVACPDPEERLIMRIERGPLCPLRSSDLT